MRKTLLQRHKKYLCQQLLLTSLTLGAVQAVLADLDFKITGVDNDVEDNIELHLSRWKTINADNVDAIEKIIGNDVQQALKALGYYAATVNYQLEEDELILDINAGQPIVWANSQITWQNNQKDTRIENKDNKNILTIDDSLKTMIAANPFIKGEKINHNVYENYKKRLLNGASELGYLDAKFSRHELQIDPANFTAEVFLTLQLGQRYRISGIEYSGTDVRETLLDTLVDVKTGEWYSANTVGLIYNRLLNTGYFSNVDVSVQKKNPDQVDLNVVLTDKARHNISTGVGFGTDDKGPRVRLKWQLPRLNQRGDSLSTQLKLSRIEQNISAQYKVPWDHPLNEYLSYDIGWQQKINEDVTTQLATAGASYHRVMNNGWQYSFRLDVENETSQIDDQRDEDFTYVIPSVQFSRRKFKGEAIDPLSGYKFWANLSTSRENIGSDTDFHRFDIGANGVLTLAKKHSFVSRVEFGYIDTDDILKVPLSQRFFAGGDQTVRGYGYETIAPVDEENNVTGGQYAWIGSIEYRYQFLKNWKAAIFYDTAQIYRDDPIELPADSIQATQWLQRLEASKTFQSGAGIGIRWKTPVGLIAFDVATPLDQDERDIRVHFYLGTPL